MSRPRTPSALKLVKGTQRADRANGHEPEPPVLVDLDPPAHLEAGPAAVWRQLAPALRQALVLTEADVVAFELLCNAVADVRQARQQRAGEFVAYSPKGGQMLHQLLVAEQMLVKRIESLGARFGMDPASRSRLHVDPQSDLFDKPPAANGTGRFFT